jgi:phosphoribosylamine-glycine ligase
LEHGLEMLTQAFISKADIRGYRTDQAFKRVLQEDEGENTGGESEPITETDIPF